jgi:hypothetical protein
MNMTGNDELNQNESYAFGLVNKTHALCLQGADGTLVAHDGRVVWVQLLGQRVEQHRTLEVIQLILQESPGGISGRSVQDE